jgi:GR25 family glycosyltransferase involved in LPS biosynthesis
MFDRVVCINLARRPDRWQRFQQGLPADWPFRPVERFEAIDGQRVPPPQWYGRSDVPDWKNRRCGPWGCLRSHLAVWEQVLNTACDDVLIFEDDALFADDFAERVQAFLDAMPANWHQLYLGGQHLYPEHNPPEVVNDWVLRGRNINRTHAYAITRPMMHALYRHLSAPWEANCWRDWHLDYRMGAWHLAGKWNVYAPLRVKDTRVAVTC